MQDRMLHPYILFAREPAAQEFYNEVVVLFELFSLEQQQVVNNTWFKIHL